MARTGRPRGFDKQEALRQAMHLFWEQGYEATSLTQLKVAMGGISAASFYAAFESKEALFRDVLVRYLASHGQVTAPLQEPYLPPRTAIEQTLLRSARMQTDSGHPLGCLVILSTSTCSPQNRHLQALLAAERAHNRQGIQDCVTRAVALGELAAGTDTATLAAVFDTFLVGLSTQARDGVGLARLEASISLIMGVWDALAASQTRH